jgi:hypothetical protein
LQVNEFFQDFDTLRSGSISKPQFQRGLSVLGLSALGQHRLTDAQLKMLCSYYQNPMAEDKVLWTRFKDDVESGIYALFKLFAFGLHLGIFCSLYPA